MGAVEGWDETQGTCTWTWADWTSTKFQGLTKHCIIRLGREFVGNVHFNVFGGELEKSSLLGQDSDFKNQSWWAAWWGTMFVLVIGKGDISCYFVHWQKSSFILYVLFRTLKESPSCPSHLIFGLFLFFFLSCKQQLLPSFSTAQRRLMVGFLSTNTRQKRLRLELCKMDQPDFRLQNLSGWVPKSKMGCDHKHELPLRRKRCSLPLKWSACESRLRSKCAEIQTREIRSCPQTFCPLQLNTLQTNTDNDTVSRDPHTNKLRPIHHPAASPVSLLVYVFVERHVWRRFRVPRQPTVCFLSGPESDFGLPGCRERWHQALPGELMCCRPHTRPLSQQRSLFSPAIRHCDATKPERPMICTFTFPVFF